MFLDPIKNSGKFIILLFLSALLFHCPPPSTPNLPEINIKRIYTTIPVGGSFDFGSTIADGNGGVTSGNITFTIENLGTAELTVSLNALDGTNSADFDIISSPSSFVAPASSTTFILCFDPLTTGDKSATVSVTNNDVNENPYNFTITGTSIPVAGPEIHVQQGSTPLADGGSFDFGSTLADGNDGTASANISFTIENPGTADLIITLDALGGTDSGDFDIISSPTSPITAGGNSTFALRFDPLTAGAKSATVSITNNDADENPYTFTITGTGTGILGGTIQGIVVDSVGGAPVSGAAVQVESTGFSANTDASGQFTISSIPVGTYDLVVTKAGRAGSKLQAVTVTESTTTNVEIVETEYSLYATGVVPPTINVTGITKGSTYTGNVNINISVTAGSYPIVATHDHFSVILKIGEKGSLVSTANSNTDTLAYIWNTASHAPGSININIVAYDLNNNRSEWDIPVNIGASAGTIPAVAPANYSIQALTFGKSLNIYSQEIQALSNLGVKLSKEENVILTSPLAAQADSSVVVLFLVEKASGTNGINIYRSDTQTGTYTLIGETTYSYFDSYSGLYHYQFMDTSATLTPGQDYWYRVSYFNQYGEGPQTAAQSALILPKYYLNLTAPANNTIIFNNMPTFEWTSGTIASATRTDYVILKEVNGESFLIVTVQVENDTSAGCLVPLPYNKQYEWNVISNYTYINGPHVESISYPSQKDASNNGFFYFTVMP